MTGEPTAARCPACDATSSSFRRVESVEYAIDGVPHRDSIAECSECGTQFAVVARAAAAEWYSEREVYAWRWEFDRFLEDLRALRLSTVLEIGCGEGELLEHVSRDHEACGIDFNEKAVEVARRKGLDVLAGTLAELRSRRPGRRFDVVALFHVIEHLEDPFAFLNDVAGLLAPGGRLFLSTPNPERCTLEVGREYWDYPPHHLVRFSKSGLETLLRRAGFRVEKALDQPAEDEAIRLAKLRVYRGLSLPKKLRQLIKLPVLAMLAPFGAWLRRTRSGLAYYVVARRAVERDGVPQ